MAEPAVVAPLPDLDATATVLAATAPPATVPASNKKRKAKGKGPAEPASAADALQVKPAAKRKGKGPPAGEVSGSKKPKTGDAGTAAELPRSDGQTAELQESTPGHGAGPSGLAPGLKNDRQSGPEEARTSGWTLSKQKAPGDSGWTLSKTSGFVW